MTGLVLGAAVGDALGLPREGLSARRGQRLLGVLRHAFVFGRGMFSDDTEHLCMTAAAFLSSEGDPQHFSRDLARRLRWWLAALPAGVGMATAKSILKLWLGFAPARSGVCSAGNGPVMRSAVLAACRPDDAGALAELVACSSRLTHADQRAIEGAQLVAEAARMALTADRFDAPAVLRTLRDGVVGAELRQRLDVAVECLEQNAEPSAYCERIGLRRGVSGYINHTVPVCLYCWCRQPDDYRAALTDVIHMGGDADTTATVVGTLVGARVGASGLPNDWVAGVCDWPLSVGFLRSLAEAVAARIEQTPAVRCPTLFWPAIPFRNIVFLTIVLLHGFRRLLPPY